MLGVELLGHGGDTATGDGLLAAGAQRAAPLVVVNLTVRLPVVLKEAAVDKRREAFLSGTRGKRLRNCPWWVVRRGLAPPRERHLCGDPYLLVISYVLG